MRCVNPHPSDQARVNPAHLESLKAALEAEDADLVCAWLFGSTARGEARADSDLDVGVLFETDPPQTLAGLHLDLADALTEAAERPVDLVVLNRAPVNLIHFATVWFPDDSFHP